MARQPSEIAKMLCGRRSVSKQAHDKVQTIDVIWWGKSIEEDSGGSRDRHDASRLVDCVNVAEDKLDGCCRGEIG